MIMADRLRAENAEKERDHLKAQLQSLKEQSIVKIEQIGGNITDDKAAWEHSVVHTIISQQKQFDELQKRQQSTQEEQDLTVGMLRDKVRILTEQNMQLLHELQVIQNKAKPGPVPSLVPPEVLARERSLSPQRSLPPRASSKAHVIQAPSSPASSYHTDLLLVQPNKLEALRRVEVQRAQQVMALQNSIAEGERERVQVSPLAALRERGSMLENQLRYEDRTSFK